MSISSEELTENRKLALHELETNPRGYRKISGRLSDCEDGRCASGLLCETFHIEIPVQYCDDNDALKTLDKLLGYGTSSDIITKNDCAGLPYKRIADFLRKQWGL